MPNRADYKNLIEGVLENDIKKVQLAIDARCNLKKKVAYGDFGAGYGFDFFGFGDFGDYYDNRLSPYIGQTLEDIALSLGHQQVYILLNPQAHEEERKQKLLAQQQREREASEAKEREASEAKEREEKQRLQLTRGHVFALDGTVLAFLEEGEQHQTPLLIDGTRLLASVAADNTLTLKLLRARGTDEVERGTFETKDFARRLELVKAEVATLQAQSNSFLTALQQCEHVDMDEFTSIQAALGLQKKTLKDMHARESLAFTFQAHFTTVSVRVQPHQVFVAPALLRIPFIWQPAGTVTVADTTEDREGLVALPPHD